MAEVFEKFDRTALVAIKARNLPKLRAANFFTVDPDGDATAAAECMKLADEYFAHFTRDEGGKCLCCGEQLGGGRDLLNLLGTFTWGIASGEGFCGKCGYPARAIHRIKDVGTISNFILPYHPDGLSFPEGDT